MKRVITAVFAALLIAAVIVIVTQQRQIAQLRAVVADLRASASKPPSASHSMAKRGAAPAIPVNAGRLQTVVEGHAVNSAASWQDRAALLKEVLAELPEQSIPELSLATEDDWLDAARGKLETPDDYRRAFAKLRNASVGHFVLMLEHAVRKYVAANGGTFPDSVSALQPLIERPVDGAIWSRYIIAPAGAVPNLRFGSDRIVMPATVVDMAYDKTFAVGPNGSGNTDFGTAERSAVYGAYRKAMGSWPKTPADALPYASNALERAVIQADIDRFQAQGREKTAGP